MSTTEIAPAPASQCVPTSEFASKKVNQHLKTMLEEELAKKQPTLGNGASEASPYVHNSVAPVFVF